METVHNKQQIRVHLSTYTSYNNSLNSPSLLLFVATWKHCLLPYVNLSRALTSLVVPHTIIVICYPPKEPIQGTANKQLMAKVNCSGHDDFVGQLRGSRRHQKMINIQIDWCTFALFVLILRNSSPLLPLLLLVWSKKKQTNKQSSSGFDWGPVIWFDFWMISLQLESAQEMR